MGTENHRLCRDDEDANEVPVSPDEGSRFRLCAIEMTRVGRTTRETLVLVAVLMHQACGLSGCRPLLPYIESCKTA